MIDALATGYVYAIIVAMMMASLFVLLTTGNLIRKMIGLSLFQTTAGLFYIALSKVGGGTAPIIIDAESAVGQARAARLDPAYVEHFGVDGVVYGNPLPHVLILTAIVVGVATLSVGLAIAVRVREAYGDTELDAVRRADAAASEPEPPGPRGRPNA
ncbi:NADH:quinone oxidoreductase [bacterium]|nr:NADH:quinone oxidoreductase [bacterium]